MLTKKKSISRSSSRAETLLELVAKSRLDNWLLLKEPWLIHLRTPSEYLPVTCWSQQHYDTFPPVMRQGHISICTGSLNRNSSETPSDLSAWLFGTLKLLFLHVQKVMNSKDVGSNLTEVSSDYRSSVARVAPGRIQAGEIPPIHHITVICRTMFQQGTCTCNHIYPLTQEFWSRKTSVSRKQNNSNYYFWCMTCKLISK